jgi:hypothetical protein
MDRRPFPEACTWQQYPAPGQMNWALLCQPGGGVKLKIPRTGHNHALTDQKKFRCNARLADPLRA